jgi:hypothetical protein
MVGDGLTRTFAGTGVGLVALTAARKILLMSLSTIGADFLKSLDIKSNLTAKVTFDDILADLVTDSGQFFFGAVLDSLGSVDLGILTDFLRSGESDTVDVTERID